jgi:hypothetical protein
MAIRFSNDITMIPADGAHVVLAKRHSADASDDPHDVPPEADDFDLLTEEGVTEYAKRYAEGYFARREAIRKAERAERPSELTHESEPDDYVLQVAKNFLQGSAGIPADVTRDRIGEVREGLVSKAMSADIRLSRFDAERAVDSSELGRALYEMSYVAKAGPRVECVEEVDLSDSEAELEARVIALQRVEKGVSRSEAIATILKNDPALYAALVQQA